MATRSFSRTAKTTTRTTRTGAGHFPGEEGAAQSGPWTGFRQTTTTRGGGMAAAGESERLLERDDDEPRSSWCNKWTILALVLAAIVFAYWKFGDYIFFWNHLTIRFGWKKDDEDTSPPAPPSANYDGDVFKFLTKKGDDDAKVFGYLTGR